MGIDSKVLVRENSIAVRADFALVAASASTIPSAFFWFGQITNQTLNHMIAPRYIPIPIVVWREEPREEPRDQRLSYMQIGRAHV